MRAAVRRRANMPQALIDLKANTLPVNGSIASIESVIETEKQLIDKIVRKHYSKITDSEWDYLKRRQIVNGLGPQWNKVLVFFGKLMSKYIPEKVWYAHDLSYYIGWDEIDREKSDTWLLNHLRMRIDWIKAWTLVKCMYKVFAIWAYTACYFGGGKHFNYTKQATI